MKVRILKGSGGLNTETDPIRSGYDPAIGVWDFAACVNIDISDKFRISRRKGFTRKLAGNSHSLVAIEDKYCLFCVSDVLCRLESNLTDYSPIAVVTPDKRLSVIILDSKVYWCNGREKGIVIDGINHEWTAATSLVSSNVTRVFNDPPIGHLLAYHNGRIYVVDGKIVWYSEPYGPNLFSKGDCFISLESNIQMIRPVDGGIYISDEYSTWFLKGQHPKEFVWNKIEDTPALPYSAEPIQARITIDQTGLPVLSLNMSSMAAIWSTNKGICFGTSDGQITRLTERKIDLPDEYSSGACLVNGATLIGQFN